MEENSKKAQMSAEELKELQTSELVQIILDLRGERDKANESVSYYKSLFYSTVQERDDLETKVKTLNKQRNSAIRAIYATLNATTNADELV